MITLTREEAQQVLDAMEYHVAQTRPITRTQETIETLRARLAQPEPEPVAWAWVVNSGAGYYTRGVGFDKTDIPFAKHTPLYTAPPQREWQRLTEEEIMSLLPGAVRLPPGWSDTVQAIEAKLKEKNV
jgi:DNA-binding transcriptional MocR family regulator